MRFQKYSSITNHYQTEFIERIKLEGKDGGTWIATEKIHGANFSIWVNATNTRIAKRSGLMPDDTGFFNVYNIAHELKERARYLYRTAKLADSKIKEVVIYGELFGGSYPHPKIEDNPKYKMVQKGVWYAPDLQFAVFDIKVDGEFLDCDLTYLYCVNTGFFPIPTIYEGSFKDCLSLRNDYLSVVHKEWSLPKIKGNIMEGIVIRPVDNRYLRRGERVIIKSKNRKFSETNDRKPKRPMKLRACGKKFIEMAIPMVTGNRYDSAISKIGDVTPRDFGRILGAIVQDIHDEISKDEKFYNKFKKMDKIDRGLVHRTLAPEVSILVREKLLGIKP